MRLELHFMISCDCYLIAPSEHHEHDFDAPGQERGAYASGCVALHSFWGWIQAAFKQV